MKKIAIFGSGSGSNAENICSFFANYPDIKVVLIGTNNKHAFIVSRAKKLEIPVVVFSKSELNNFDVLYKELIEKEVEYIILAGFLLKVPLSMVESFVNKIINIHPSLLPKYSGRGMYGNNVHEAVLKNKDIISGITIHLVNEKYDDGEVLFQKSCNIFLGETVTSLSKKITKLEHLFFPEIIKNYLRR